MIDWVESFINEWEGSGVQGGLAAEHIVRVILDDGGSNRLPDPRWLLLGLSKC